MPRGHQIFFFAALALGAPAIAGAQEPDAADAVRNAAAAFEYRDFQKVVDTLEPWVHPPRISDRALMIEARRLLGVSYHVLGDVKSAREEFGQLLLADPLHKLDPFVIPPKVIETFESVRKEMKPMLDRVLAERGLRPDPVDGPEKLVIVEIPSRWVTLIPGGIPQFVLGEPELGAAFGSAQLLGLAANFTGFFMDEALDRDDPEFGTWKTIQYVGLASALVAYAVSVVVGNLAFDAHQRSLLDRAAADNGRKRSAFQISIDLP